MTLRPIYLDRTNIEPIKGTFDCDLITCVVEGAVSPRTIFTAVLNPADPELAFRRYLKKRGTVTQPVGVKVKNHHPVVPLGPIVLIFFNVELYCMHSIKELFC